MPDPVSGVAPGPPAAFTVLPLSYDNAYGGVDRPTPSAATHVWYPTNHVGRGFGPSSPVDRLYGQPLPNTEELGAPVRRRDGKYRPMAFSPLARSWQQRVRWAGTYDTVWRKTKYPFLPDDFDERYYQCAPEDQQTDHIRGGEDVVLMNLTPRGHTQFRLPKLAETLAVFYKNGDVRRLRGVVDTLTLEPDLERFTLTLRAAVELRRSVHEIARVEIGPVLPQPVPDEGTSQLPVAKVHYRSLSELAAANRTAGRKS